MLLSVYPYFSYRLEKHILKKVVKLKLLTFKMGLPHFCNTQLDPDLDLLGSEIIC
jgi:hypothetical protein